MTQSPLIGDSAQDKPHPDFEIETPLVVPSWIDYPALAFFWILFGIVFLQFFTRYVLNDSLGWTEEIARYLLILVGFVGSATCVRKNGHIYLEFLYRMLPAPIVKGMSLFALVVSVGFFGFCAWLSVGLSQKTAFQQMTSVALPKNIIYWIVGASFVAMTLAALFRLVKMWRKRADALAEDLADGSPLI